MMTKETRNRIVIVNFTLQAKPLVVLHMFPLFFSFCLFFVWIVVVVVIVVVEVVVVVVVVVVVLVDVLVVVGVVPLDELYLEIVDSSKFMES